MSKPRTKQPKDVTPFWLSRGFRPDVAATPPSRDEDPKGEAAYQRAFYDAAQSKPPRLPNPSHYPNSSSAREYVRRRSMEPTGVRGEKRVGEGGSDAFRAVRQQRDPNLSADDFGKKSSSTSPASSYSTSAMPSLPSLLSAPRYQEDTTNQSSGQRQLPLLPPLASLVASPTTTAQPAFLQTGPKGPSGTLRPWL